MTLRYMTGFGGHFESEAVEGALPKGRNSPHPPPSASTPSNCRAPLSPRRGTRNRRTGCTGCARPQTMRRSRNDGARMFSPTMDDRPPLAPNRLRWTGPGIGREHRLRRRAGDDMTTPIAAGAEAAWPFTSTARRRSMDAPSVSQIPDGEMLILPQSGPLLIVTEMGRLDVPPGRRVDPAWGPLPGRRAGDSRAIVAEITARCFRLPDSRPDRANGLASAARFPKSRLPHTKISDGPHELIQKYGRDVDDDARPQPDRRRRLARQPRPPGATICRAFRRSARSASTIPTRQSSPCLTSPTKSAWPARRRLRHLSAAMDGRRGYVPPAPWFHRNVMTRRWAGSRAEYDAKAEGFAPGGLSLHNLMRRARPGRRQLAKSDRCRAGAGQDRRTMAFMVEKLLAVRAERASQWITRSPITTSIGANSPRQNCHERRDKLGRWRGSWKRFPDREFAARHLLDAGRATVPASRSGATCSIIGRGSATFSMRIGVRPLNDPMILNGWLVARPRRSGGVARTPDRVAQQRALSRRRRGRVDRPIAETECTCRA